MKINRFFLSAAVSLLLSALCFADDSVLDTVPCGGYKSAVELSEGLTYIKTVDTFGTYAEREYILSYVPNDETRLSFVTGQYLHYTDNIRTMAAYAYPEDNFLGGINADFFNMSTGVPESALIIDGELYSTDRDSNCLARRSNGTYFIGKPAVRLTLTDHSDDVPISVAHLNKEYTVYGLYLYDSRYAVYTNVFTPNTTVTLMPYDDVIGIEEMQLRYDVGTESTEEENSTDEEIITEEEPDYTALEEASGYIFAGDAFYHPCTLTPALGTAQKLVSVEIKTSSDSLAIKSGAYMLCYSSADYSYLDSRFAPGKTFTLSIEGDESFDDVTDAIGTGAVIVKDGEPIDDRSLDHYTSLQPRSAVGIREDGSLLFYGLDGRQSGISSGLKVFDMAKRLIELGCVSAANFDGGGSTAVNAHLPGYDSAITVNSPSDRSERKVSNAVIFTNSKKKLGNATGAYLYADYLTTYDDMPLTLPSAKLSDANGYAAETVPFNLSVSPDKGSIDVNVYYPSGADGIIPVMAKVGENENTAGYVLCISEPDKLTLRADKARMKVYETAKITLSASFCLMNINSSEASYSWTMDGTEFADIYPSEDGQGMTIEFENARIVNDVLYPKCAGTALHLGVRRGSKIGEFSIIVAPLPFADIENHWGLPYIDKLYDRGVVIGEPGEDGNMYFFPSRSYSRAEFCVMVSRIVDLSAYIKETEADETPADTDEALEDTGEALPYDEEAVPDTDEEQIEAEEPLTDEEDVLPYADEVRDWALDAVTQMYRAGFLDAIAHTDEEGNPIFDGAAPITREEVIRILGSLCDSAPESYTVSYPDLSAELAADPAFRNALYKGLFGGYEDGTLRPGNVLTRAEGATVFTRLLGIR